MQKRLTPAERAVVLAAYQAGESSEALGRRFGVTGVAIRAQLRKAGIARRDASTSHRIYPVRQDAFSQLTPAVEYWLGMMITDGSVCYGDGTPRIELGLAEKDRAHVVKFRDFLESTAPIYRKVDKDGNVSCRYSVRSVEMAADLSRHGITRRKTFTAKATSALARSRHFWRGVVDGDGEIKDAENFPVLRVLGTKLLCEQLQAFCVSLGVKEERTFIAPMRSVFYVEMGGNDALKVEDHLYADAGFALDRKIQKVERLAQKYAGRSFRILPQRRAKEKP